MRKAIGTAVLVWAGFLALVELDIRWCHRRRPAPLDGMTDGH